MELALSLGGGGDAGPRPLSLLVDHKDVGFCMGLRRRSYEDVSSSDPVVPYSPRPSSQLLRLLPWLTPPPRDKVRSEREGSVPAVEGDASSFQMVFSARNNYVIKENKKREYLECSEDEDDKALTRKKLRLSKDQSAFLEETFKQHTSLNPKQKQALAKQLNLGPRQVEVWFQNRRARTKLKQTEVDCEYLKRRCETLGEENKRLQKEVQELRALKTSQPFYNQRPPTTLTMCPSCERVASTSPSSSVDDKPSLMLPFFREQSYMHQAQSQAQAH